ncbi:MAG: hypothetical protein ACRCTY_05335, partial [Candidatus Adiutrix sp.]
SGSHYHGMGRRLAMSFPQLMGKLEDGVTRLADQFQSEVFWAAGHKEKTPIGAILGQVSFGLLASRVLESFKLHPKAVIGYSLGEVAALVATGAWPEREALYNDLINSPLFTQELGGRFMAPRRYWQWPENKPLKWVIGVVPRTPEAIKKTLDNLPRPQRERAFLLMINTNNECVIGGEESAVKSLAHALGTMISPIDDVAAVHNPAVALVAHEYEKFHTRPTVPPFGVKFYSAAWGRSYELSSKNIALSLTEQALKGHNFAQLIEQAYDDGVRFFVELGPGASASRLISNILKDRPHLAKSLSPNAHEEGWLGVNRLLVELWMAGLPLKMAVLYPDCNDTATMKLPISVDLAPQSTLWPLPEAVLPKTTLGAQMEATLKAAPLPETSKPQDRPQNKPQNKLYEQAKTLGAENLNPLMPLSREKCLEFATGKIASVLGPRFAEVDNFPSRVRLPDEPLMFVDRVISIEGEPLSMASGRIVTELDVRPHAWYLDNNHMPLGLAIESGQADLMLSAWLGADFATKGLALYRLLDAEVTFHRDFLPKVGETVRFDIRIIRFFKYGQTHLFRFEFEATINGQALLTMKNGCAGFFTPEELAKGRGLPQGGLSDNDLKPHLAPEFLRPQILPTSLNSAQLMALRHGDLSP